jgi:hypothetical protein
VALPGIDEEDRMSSNDHSRNGGGASDYAPSWIRGGDRKRDPETGHLKLRVCERYTSGHSVHYIQAIHSYGKPHRAGQLVDVTDNVLTVDFGEETKQYQTHDPERLLDIVGISGDVRVCDCYTILRRRNSCFSISDIDGPWVPCDYEPLRSTTPEALAKRVETHGGFTVPGHLVLRGSTR